MTTTSSCAACPLGGERTKATNETGMEVQEYATNRGWFTQPHLKFETCCEAVAALRQLPNDGVERRIYPTLEFPVMKDKK